MSRRGCLKASKDRGMGKAEVEITVKKEEGYIYILRNPAFPDKLKVGRAKKPEERAKELSRPTGVPGYYEVIHERKCADYRTVEKDVHKALDRKGYRYNKEFFKGPLEEVKKVVDAVVLDHNPPLVPTPKTSLPPLPLPVYYTAVIIIILAGSFLINLFTQGFSTQKNEPISQIPSTEVSDETVKKLPADDSFNDEKTNDVEQSEPPTDLKPTITVLPAIYTLTLQVDGEGTTTPAEGSNDYEEEKEVNITATPEDGWEFSHWKGDATGDNIEIKVTIDSDKEITAVFIQDKNTVISFTDAQIEEAVRGIIDIYSSVILCKDVSTIEELRIPGLSIADIGGIEYFESLRYLDLGSNKIEDISPLSALTDLKHLNLWGNRIEDIKPLKYLVNLEWLNLNQNKVQDVSPLTHLVNLKTVFLVGNKIDNAILLKEKTNIENIIY